jgi:ribosomal-protein-alanine N-acetyltransferase
VGGTTTPTLQIGLLELDELPSVLEIENLSFPTPWSLSSFRYEMLENPYASLFGARMAGVPGVVGFACAWVIDQEMKINNLAVHPRWRSQGVGGRLLDHLLEFARRQGCLEASLEVRPSNQAALRLYSRIGFVPIGRRKAYYSDTHEDAVVMLCRLGLRSGR